MGLIKAIGGAIRGTMADQWKEYFVMRWKRMCLLRRDK